MDLKNNNRNIVFIAVIVYRLLKYCSDKSSTETIQDRSCKRGDIYPGKNYKKINWLKGEPTNWGMECERHKQWNKLCMNKLCMNKLFKNK